MFRLGSLGSFVLAGTASFAMAVNAAFIDAFNWARLVLMLGLLLLLHLARFPKLVLTRESRLYALFIAYMIVQLAWTRDAGLALNTLMPAVAFLLILVLLGSLLASHDERPVLGGTLAGLLCGAMIYSASTGFPFEYPPEFSYNAIAMMYLSGLFVSVMLASRGRLTAPYVGIGGVFLVLIMATTSIKANLGILLGILVSAVLFGRHYARSLRRFSILIAVLACGMAYAVISNQALVGAVRRGVDRVGVGLEVLQARENTAGYSGFSMRSAWQDQGLTEWVGNPVFGYGVEAFRSEYGVTSHSSLVDILHNSGLIGFALFYGIAVSIMWRLYRSGRCASEGARATILVFGTCFLFMSLAGNIHYNSSLAVFVAISAAILGRRPVDP